MARLPPRPCTWSVFQNFVKSMPPSLSELKVTPSFCFAFKIPDDVTATNKQHMKKLLVFWFYRVVAYCHYKYFCMLGAHSNLCLAIGLSLEIFLYIGCPWQPMPGITVWYDLLQWLSDTTIWYDCLVWPSSTTIWCLVQLVWPSKWLSNLELKFQGSLSLQPRLCKRMAYKDGIQGWRTRMAYKDGVQGGCTRTLQGRRKRTAYKDNM